MPLVDICSVMIELHIHISLKISKILSIHLLVICFGSTLVISLSFTVSHLIKNIHAFHISYSSDAIGNYG